MPLKYVVRLGRSRKYRTYWGVAMVKTPFKGPLIIVWNEGHPELWRYDVPVADAVSTLKQLYKDDFGFEPAKIQIFAQRE